MERVRDCTIYKIGQDLYNNGDKNSGLYEYNLIADAVSKSFVEDTLVIINGKISKSDEFELEELLKTHKHKIFISSDAISFDTNINIINECDVLLHQCPFNKISHVKSKVWQHYSYVPELFYKPFDKPISQDNLLLYGGGLRNDKVLEYLSSVPSKSLLKTSELDNRLNYLDYLDEAMKHKFTLIISRQDYIELGWVTSRFIEAAGCWNYPIVDIDYDRHQYFGASKIVSMNDLVDRINKLSNNEYERESRIKYYRQRFAKDKHNFRKLIEELTK